MENPFFVVDIGFDVAVFRFLVIYGLFVFFRLVLVIGTENIITFFIVL